MSIASAPTVISAFTVEQASRLTMVSARQLAYWAASGFFVPSLPCEASIGIPVRLYSFRDVVCLKVIGVLRNEAKVPLPHLRAVKDRLAHLGEDLWAKTTLYVLGRRVVFDNPDTGEREDAANGQGVFQIPLIVVTGKMEEAIRLMRKRESGAIGKIDIKRTGVRNPVIAGTRIPVRTIQSFVGSGYSAAEIAAQFPSLTEADVHAAMNYTFAA